MNAIEIEQRVAVIQSKPGFSIPAWWLTFYLSASPQQLDVMAQELVALKATNLDNSGGGFLYPKLPVANSLAAISALIGQVENMAMRYGVDVIAVDADTTCDPSTSQFEEIIHLSRS